ncbi:amino acid adenylation domain-containing protein, partial [Streptomyces sp. NPDC058195]|uniref:non-ribosomal peptide synthetase n=1 Tax=Streptomyces sp. NPDC058195 TaxID=3346375 RepID=UPI0036F01D89
VVATPVAGRNHPSFDQLIGFFVNNLVLRTDLGGEPGFREVLRRVRETVLDAQDHQDLPFDMVLSATRPPRTPDRTPYLQTTLVHQPESVLEYRIGDLVATPMQAPLPGAPVDLVFSVFEGTSTDIQVNYRSDLFDADSVKSISEQFVDVLRRGVSGDEGADPGPRASKAAEQPASVLVGPERPDLLNLDLGQALGAIAHRQPDATALQSAGDSLTYSELIAASDEVAASLRAAGVGKGHVVGLSLEPGLALVITLVATVRIGAAYMCLDTAAPEERNAWLLDDAGCSVVVSHTDVSAPNEWVSLTYDRLSQERRPWGGRDDFPASKRPAYIVYTSGSTGEPKGVVLVHDAVCNWALGMGEAMRVGPRTNVAQLASPSFDVMSAEVWMALLTGARLSVIPRHERRGASVTAEALGREGVTLYMGTPGPLTVIDPDVVPLIDKIVVGGDVLSDTLVKKWLPQAAVGQVYGASEGTMSTTIGVLDAGTPSNRAGSPLPNTSIRVLSETLEPLPMGTVGEIFISGIGVGHEYFERRSLTAEKFLPDPFSGVPGSRMYRTGDLGRVSPSGEVEFIGRCDDMVKIRGVRVEPAEVEAAVSALAGVSACAVAADKDKHGATILRAYVIMKDPTIDERSLRALIEAALPASMIPHAIVYVDSFPLTANGKVDRARLLEISPSGAKSGGRGTLSEAMNIVLDVWEEVLDHSPIAVSDNFFELGGDSLGAIRSIAKLEPAFSVRIEFSEFLRNPTAHGLLRHIEGLRGVGAKTAPLPRTPPSSRVALSFGQRRLWLADQVAPGSLAYSTPFVLR